MAWAASFDPFDALGLERDADLKTIRARYRDLARRYHPNRNLASEQCKAGLAERFHHVHNAWQHLERPDRRRRCVERLDLDDLREAVHAAAGDLSDDDESDVSESSQKDGSVGHISSDADEDDEDLPRIAGIKRRQTFDRPLNNPRTLDNSLDDITEDANALDPTSGGRRTGPGNRNSRGQRRLHPHDRSNEDNTTALRRKQLDKLRRKEREAFESYWDAMMAKFEAEHVAERYQEQFEKARWKREYFERAPRDTSARVRLINLVNNATKAFASQKPMRRRTRSLVSYAGQLPASDETFEFKPGGQFLKLPSRHKSIRRRGYSSDMTADQTSSSEEKESTRSRSTQPRAVVTRPQHNGHHRWASLPNIIPSSPRNIPNGDHDIISPITGPCPKVLVRQPTNLNELLLQGSDADSASASLSSRTPSPQSKGNGHLNRFTLVSTRHTPDLLDRGHDRRSLSSAAEQRSPPVSRTRSLPRVLSEQLHFQIKTIGLPQYEHIPTENVHELSYADKQWILGVDPDADTDPAELLQRLAELDEGVAAKFMVKPEIKASFRFRLIHDRPHIAHRQSFIALSYRRKIHVGRGDEHFTLPLEQEMFQAVWDERNSPEEGVWIDQICIDGDSDLERTISMSAMDMVYRSARLVVVALDDIELHAGQASVLELHMQEFDRQTHVPANKRFRRRRVPYLETREELYKVICTILRSSWFRRAWCRHEMRLAREHIFLVPCQASTGKSVLRFTGRCLTHLLGLACEVPFEQEVENVKPALYAFFRDRSKLPGHHDDHERSHHGNFTTVVAEVFGMEAGGDPRIPEEQRAADARKDKISIILNTMECGLALRPHLRATQFGLPSPECYYMLLLLALAARDPGALCSVGHPLHDLPIAVDSTWLFEPTNVDSGLNNYRSLNRLPPHHPITIQNTLSSQFVRLGLQFLPQPPNHPISYPSTLRLAHHFISVCAARNLGRNRARYLLADHTATHLFGSMLDVYAQTLASVLELGPDWLRDVARRHGVSRWDHDVEPAANLMIALRNTCGRWPESAWNPQAAAFLMDFVNFLIIRGMPTRQMTGREEWRPVWICGAPNAWGDGGGKVLTFVPPGKDVRVAVPVALGDDDYIHLARVWVLRPRVRDEGDVAGGVRAPTLEREREPLKEEWTLLGKSVVFGDEVAARELEDGIAGVKSGQVVFGRRESRATRAVHSLLHP